VPLLAAEFDKVRTLFGILSFGFRKEAVVPLGGPGDLPRHEMLLILHDQNGQRVSNETFFGVARAQGSQVPIDSYLFEKALRQAKQDGVFPVSINIDLLTALDPRFAERAAMVATELGIEDGDVVVELTEHSDLPPNTLANGLVDLKRAGFRLAVDDLNLLSERDMDRLFKLVPFVDIVKIDHSVLGGFRSGAFKDAGIRIQSIKESFPWVRIVIEGATQEDHDAGHLHRLGGDSAQFFEPFPAIA
jgi:EAL domain-containing protein (putative c-di-GMP-specific phosphodiesterase class I)